MLKAPFPYFGGKSLIASRIWAAFGNVPNYVEPFCGSAAVLLARPEIGKTETVNDVDCMISNFWRAVQSDPDSIVQYMECPVSEVDLHARHQWLVQSQDMVEFRERMRTDPDYYDPKIAGWWCWGKSAWIGKGWCSGKLSRQKATISHIGSGVHSLTRRHRLPELFGELQHRLRHARVLCGDWDRCFSPSMTDKLGVTGVFLDPPYGNVGRDSRLYMHDSYDVAAEVRTWCAQNGHDPKLRICLAGYDWEGHEQLGMMGWTCDSWVANGGYASQNKTSGNPNRKRERLWFSPHCLTQTEGLYGRAIRPTDS